MSTAEQRRKLLIEGPIARALFQLAYPTILVLLVQTLVNLAQTWLVSRLGTTAIASVAVVLPWMMLMLTMSSAGVGGGVASAIARALGSGEHERVNALAVHAVVIAIGFGACFTLLAWWLAPRLYASMGARDDVLRGAVHYSNVVFAGSIPLWIVNLLSACLRGVGNVKVPAMVTVGSGVIVVPLSAVLILGWGPLGGRGIEGAGLALAGYNTLAAVVLAAYATRGTGGIRANWRSPLSRSHFASILRVGALSALGNIQANLTVILFTAAVATHGATALAGYGIASRLDYVVIPLMFGLGSAVVVMVAANSGAGQFERVEKITRVAATLASAFGLFVGIVFALKPGAWTALFTSDPAVTQSAGLYLRWVGPTYFALGIGMIAYFAGQGRGRVLIPLCAGLCRLTVAGVVARTAAGLNASLEALYGIMAVATLLYGCVSLLAYRKMRVSPVARTA